MSEVEIHVAPASVDAVRGAAAGIGRARSRVNQLLMWSLLTVVALAPLPLGSNRPFVWAITAAAMGLVAVIYAFALYRRGETVRVGLGRLAPEAILFVVLLGYLVLQVLPIGPALGALGTAGLDAVGVGSSTLSVVPGATLLMLLRVVTYGLFFFLMLQVAANDERRSLLLDAILIVITAYALFGLASLRLGDTILGIEKWAYKGSATGPFVNRNSFATFLAFGAVLAASQILNVVLEWMERRRDGEAGGDHLQRLAIYGIALGVILAASFASQSRMGVFVTLAGILVVAATSLLDSRRGASVALLGALAAIVAAGAALTFYGDGLLERLGSLERSSEIRADLYAQTLELIAQRPWTGFGGGSFELAFPLVHQLPVNPDVVWDKAHNTYLSLWAELGFVFGSIPILIVALITFRLIAALFGQHGSWRSQAVGLGVIAVGALHSTVDFSLEIQANALAFLALTAMALATTIRRKTASGS